MRNTRMIISTTALLLAATAMHAPAFAQSASDVVIMRRAITRAIPAPPTPTVTPTAPATPDASATPTPAVSPTPGTTPTPDATPTSGATPTPSVSPTPPATPVVVGHWSVGDPVVQPACSANAPTLAPVVCRDQQEREIDAALCTGPKPDGRGTTPNYAACTYAWAPGDYGDWSSNCSKNATRKRNDLCVREDAQPADRDRCDDNEAHDPVETREVTSDCSYRWTDVVNSGWSSTCSKTAKRTQTANCRRSDGEIMTGADVNRCLSSHPDAPYSETVDNTGDGNCSYSGTYAATYSSCVATSPGSTTGNKYRALTACTRSDGTDVTTYNAQNQYPHCADYISASCTKTYTATAFNQSTTCNVPNGSSSGFYADTIKTCKDEAGATVDNAYCAGQSSNRACTLTAQCSAAQYGKWAANSSNRPSEAISNQNSTPSRALTDCKNKVNATKTSGVCTVNGTTFWYPGDLTLVSSFSSNYAYVCEYK